MQRVDHGNRNIISVFANPRDGGVPYLEYVDEARGFYKLTEAGIAKAEELLD